MMCKLYKFEDWLNEERLTYYQMDEHGGAEVGVTGNFPNELLQLEKITHSEFKKIESAQKEAFGIVLDYFKQTIREKIKEIVSADINYENYKSERIIEINSEIRNLNLGDGFRDKLRYRSWDNTRIDSIKYKDIMRRRDMGLVQEYLSGINLNDYYQGGNVSPDIRIEKDAYFHALVLSYEKDFLVNLNPNCRNGILSLKPIDGRRKIYEIFNSIYERGKTENSRFTQDDAFQELKTKLEFEMFLDDNDLKSMGINISSFSTFIRTYRNNNGHYNFQ
jgi:hypothetical protein